MYQTRSVVERDKRDKPEPVLPDLPVHVKEKLQKIMICGTSPTAKTTYELVIASPQIGQWDRTDCRHISEVKNEDLILSNCGLKKREIRRLQFLELVETLSCSLNTNDDITTFIVNCHMGRNRSVLVMLLCIQKLCDCDYLTSRLIASHLNIMPYDGKSAEKHLRTFAEFTEYSHLKGGC